jgi:hypothetical protein
MAMSFNASRKNFDKYLPILNYNNPKNKKLLKPLLSHVYIYYLSNSFTFPFFFLLFLFTNPLTGPGGNQLTDLGFYLLFIFISWLISIALIIHVFNIIYKIEYEESKVKGTENKFIFNFIILVPIMILAILSLVDNSYFNFLIPFLFVQPILISYANLHLINSYTENISKSYFRFNVLLGIILFTVSFAFINPQQVIHPLIMHIASLTFLTVSITLVVNGLRMKRSLLDKFYKELFVFRPYFFVFRFWRRKIRSFRRQSIAIGILGSIILSSITFAAYANNQYNYYDGRHYRYEEDLYYSLQFEDIDNDDITEIIYIKRSDPRGKTTHDGYFYQIEIAEYSEPNLKVIWSSKKYYSISKLLIDDYDYDGTSEIIFSQDNEIVIIDGVTKSTERSKRFYGIEYENALAVNDFQIRENEGKKELIFVSNDFLVDSNEIILSVWDLTTFESKWEYIITTQNYEYISYLSISDVDNDNVDDIIIGNRNNEVIYIIDYMTHQLKLSIVTGNIDNMLVNDIDDDGDVEIITFWYGPPPRGHRDFYNCGDPLGIYNATVKYDDSPETLVTFQFDIKKIGIVENRDSKRILMLYQDDLYAYFPENGTTLNLNLFGDITAFAVIENEFGFPVLATGTSRGNIYFYDSHDFSYLKRSKLNLRDPIRAVYYEDIDNDCCKEFIVLYGYFRYEPEQLSHRYGYGFDIEVFEQDQFI